MRERPYVQTPVRPKRHSFGRRGKHQPETRLEEASRYKIIIKQNDVHSIMKKRYARRRKKNLVVIIK